MLMLLIDLLVLVVIFAVFWWILSMIPLPATFPRWIINVVVAVIFLIALISLLSGTWSLPFGHTHVLR